jgi:hypothetical protein
MGFESQFYIYFLPVALIPLIIYLIFRKKPQKIVFSSLYLLRDITKNINRKTRLKDIILLIIRTLAAALIVLLFSKPFWGDRSGYDSSGRNALVFYLDSSPSMNSSIDGRTVFDVAKSTLIRALDKSSENDRIHIFTSDPSYFFRGNRSDALKIISDIPAYGRERSLKEILDNTDSLFSEIDDTNKMFFMFTDGNSEPPLEEQTDHSFYKCAVIFDLKVEYSNSSIDSMFFTARNLVNVKVSASGKEQSALDVYKNGVRIYSENITWNGPGDKTVIIDTGIKRSAGEIFTSSLEEDDNIADNTFNAVLSRSDLKKILITGNENSAESKKISALLNSDRDPVFSIEFIEPSLINTVKLNDFDLIFFNAAADMNSFSSSALKRFLEDGKSMFFCSGSDLNLNSYNSGLIDLGMPTISGLEKNTGSYSAVSIKEISHPAFEDVFLSGKTNLSSVEIYSFFKFSDKNWKVLANAGNFPLLMENRIGKGRVLLLTTGLKKEDSNILDNGIAVPLIYNALLYLASGDINRNLSYTVGDRINTLKRSYLTEYGKTPETGKDELSDKFTLGREGFFSIFNDDGTFERNIAVNNQIEKRTSCLPFLEKKFERNVFVNPNGDGDDIIVSGAEDLTQFIFMLIAFLIVIEMLVVRLL